MALRLRELCGASVRDLASRRNRSERPHRQALLEWIAGPQPYRQRAEGRGSARLSGLVGLPGRRVLLFKRTHHQRNAPTGKKWLGRDRNLAGETRGRNRGPAWPVKPHPLPKQIECNQSLLYQERLTFPA